MNPLSTKILRLFFWACWAGTAAMPVAVIIAAVCSRELTSYILVSFFSMIGLCFASALCVKRQPRLAGFGMISVSVFLAFFFSTCVMGPITE
jgi:hypothetical protein